MKLMNQILLVVLVFSSSSFARKKHLTEEQQAVQSEINNDDKIESLKKELRRHLATNRAKKEHYEEAKRSSTCIKNIRFDEIRRDPGVQRYIQNRIERLGPAVAMPAEIKSSSCPSDLERVLKAKRELDNAVKAAVVMQFRIYIREFEIRRNTASEKEAYMELHNRFQKIVSQLTDLDAEMKVEILRKADDFLSASSKASTAAGLSVCTSGSCGASSLRDLTLFVENLEKR